MAHIIIKKISCAIGIFILWLKNYLQTVIELILVPHKIDLILLVVHIFWRNFGVCLPTPFKIIKILKYGAAYKEKMCGSMFLYFWKNKGAGICAQSAYGF